MKKFWLKLLQLVAAVGIGGMAATMALEKNGVDPQAAKVVGGLVEQAIDDAAAKYGQEE